MLIRDEVMGCSGLVPPINNVTMMSLFMRDSDIIIVIGDILNETFYYEMKNKNISLLYHIK